MANGRRRRAAGGCIGRRHPGSGRDGTPYGCCTGLDGIGGGRGVGTGCPYHWPVGCRLRLHARIPISTPYAATKLDNGSVAFVYCLILFRFLCFSTLRENRCLSILASSSSISFFFFARAFSNSILFKSKSLIVLSIRSFIRASMNWRLTQISCVVKLYSK